MRQGIRRCKISGSSVSIYPVIRVNPVSTDAGTIPRVTWADKTIPIQRGTAHAACNSCLQSQAGPACDAVGLVPASPPRLVGPPAELQRLLAALAPRLGFEMAPGAGTGLVRALAVLPGEVTLELAVSRHRGGQGLVDTAFQTLRTLLPDTDIYVIPAD